jgi:glycosidase
MATQIEAAVPQDLAAADLRPRGRVFPSPVSWRDQILYQLLPDRFSDGRESERPLFDRTQPAQFKTKDKANWMALGNKFNGGTLKGIASKLDYLQGLGVTTIWINPPWRQRADLETYHGYGIQNFLDIDPRFGTRQDLRDLVDAAHDRGMYVILDVIYNHSGNNWFYGDESTGEPRSQLPYRYAPPYRLHGWRSATGESVPTPVNLEDGVWPREFQNPDWYTRAGAIQHWEAEPWEDRLNAQVEFRRGDFFELKDLNLANPDTIAALAQVYQYWIALSDCDGFRVDAVKHVSPRESRKFCNAIHEYAQSIGKDNFLLMGEIMDSGMFTGYLELFGRNLDAVLDIISAPNQLSAMVKGLGHPNGFFDLFNKVELGGNYRQLGFYLVSVLDDHDMSSRPRKERFAAHNEALPNRDLQVAHVVGVQLTMPGIPSIYYGTEQALNGSQDSHDYSLDSRHEYIDRYIRECMFGGPFGAFETEGCHFFNPNHPTYLRIAAIARVRSRPDIVGKTLRRGHHYSRETSFEGYPFAIHGPGELIAWSQILFNNEVLMVLNSHGLEGRGAYVTVDGSLRLIGSTLTYFYNSHWSDAELRHPPQGQTIAVEEIQGRAAVRIDLPPSGMVILG